jgi:hypothetical protein
MSRDWPPGLLEEKASLKSGLAMRRVLFSSSLFLGGLVLLWLTSCTQEAQNTVGRTVQNWTGTNGVLEIYAKDKLVQRFLRIDQLSTVRDAAAPLPSRVRYGYGYVDQNLNFMVDPGETKGYFEISGGSNAIFFENYTE